MLYYSYIYCIFFKERKPLLFELLLTVYYYYKFESKGNDEYEKTN